MVRTLKPDNDQIIYVDMNINTHMNAKASPGEKCGWCEFSYALRYGWEFAAGFVLLK